MREEKYADVLEKYEKSQKTIMEAEKEAELEEKLSMTRELKFKELQENIDNYEKMEEIEVEDVIDNTYTTDNDFTTIENVDEAQKNVVSIDDNLDDKRGSIDIKGEAKDEDIYLTTSFKPFRKRFRLRKVFRILFIIIFIVLIIFLLCYFVLLPIYNYYLNSKPKVIFDKSVDYVSEKLRNVVNNTVINDDVLYYNTTFSIDSNDENLSFYAGEEYGFSIGVDVEERKYEEYIYQINDNQKYGYSYIVNDNNYYLHLSNSDKYYYIDTDDEYDLFFEEFINDVSNSEWIYLIDKYNDIIKELLEEELITSEKDQIDINGNSVDVVRNSYVLDSKNYERISKKYNELVKEDDKLVGILMKIFECQSEEEFDDILDGENVDISDDYELKFNIYTINGNEFAGFDVEENGFRCLYYYQNDNYFDFHLNLTSEYSEDEETIDDDQFVIDFNGHNNGESTDVDIKYNESKVATLNITSFDFENGISFEYDVYYDEYSYNGVFELLKVDNEYNFYISLNIDDMYIDLDLCLDFNLDGEIGYVDESNIYDYNEEDIENDVYNMFLELYMNVTSVVA